MRYSLGLVGFPIEHSISPRLHNVGLRALGLEGEYRLIPIEPGSDSREEISKILEMIRHGAINGVNVTIPYKQTVMALIDEIAPAARIGAVNTIYSKEGRLVGDNTDVAGFWRDVQTNMPWISSPQPGQLALVLGAGGAARAVAWALARASWRVAVAARRLEQARFLVADLMRASSRLGAELDDGRQTVLPGQIQAVDLNDRDIEEMGSSVRIIVNATPVGKYPEIVGSPWPIACPFPPEAAVYDVIYNPPTTRLMQDALASGLAAFNGLGMLVEQAAIALELWTGLPAPRQAMLQAVPEF